MLAKRKLQINKDDDNNNDKETKNKLTMLKLAKRIERERQLVIPDESNIHYERQLRKLATRGVVGKPITITITTTITTTITITTTTTTIIITPSAIAVVLLVYT